MSHVKGADLPEPEDVGGARALKRGGAPRRRQKVVHGADLLYEFFPHVLGEESDAFRAVPQLLLTTMGVWMPLDLYASWPVLLPFVVRDPDCRPKTAVGRVDAWSSPNEDGYLRDDNSLVKALPRALQIRGPRARRISGSRMGTEFVAAHVWRTVTGSSNLASRIPLLNSFVPNLVWLPGQIAKLTDREGSVVQQTAQAMAYAIYRSAPVAAHLGEVVESAWSMLPVPTREVEPVDPADLNWFEVTPGFLAVREQRLQAVLDGLRRVRAGRPLDKKVVASRYTAGLPYVAPDRVNALVAALERYQPPLQVVSAPGVDSTHSS